MGKEAYEYTLIVRTVRDLCIVENGWSGENSLCHKAYLAASKRINKLGEQFNLEDQLDILKNDPDQ